MPTETPGCSGRLWRLWQKLVPSDRKLHPICPPGDGSHCIRTSFTVWWHIRIIRMTRVLHSSQGLQLSWSSFDNTWQSLCLSPAECHIIPLCSLLYTGCSTLPRYVLFWDVVTDYHTVFASDTLLAVAFASPLLYFPGLKYTVQSSHSLVLCPQSSTFCVDPSSASKCFFPLVRIRIIAMSNLHTL